MATDLLRVRTTDTYFMGLSGSLASPSELQLAYRRAARALVKAHDAIRAVEATAIKAATPKQNGAAK